MNRAATVDIVDLVEVTPDLLSAMIDQRNCPSEQQESCEMGDICECRARVRAGPAPLSAFAL